MEVINKSKILIIGVTGYIGRYIVEASLSMGHPTFALVREITMAKHPDKAHYIQQLKDSGVTILFGDLYNHESLVKAIKQVDVVFSLMCHQPDKQLADQIKIVLAIKEAGNVKVDFINYVKSFCLSSNSSHMILMDRRDTFLRSLDLM